MAGTGGKIEMQQQGKIASEAAATPPDGGWGWMIVAGCFLTTICTRAVTRCVSIFFVEFQLHFGKDYSGTAWTHSLVDCTTMLCAPLGSFIGNRLSCRVTVVLGGLLSSAGLILSSFANSLEYLYLTLGVLTGLGFALSYTPAVAMVGSYFNERKALAYGIAMSGSGIGTFILAPAVQLLIEYYSWRGALLILGGFVSNLCVCGALMRPLEPSAGVWRTQEPRELENGYKVTPAVNSKLPEEQIAERKIAGHAKDCNRDMMLENGKLVQMKLTETLLANPKLAEARLTDVKLMEDLVVSSSIAEKILAEIQLTDSNKVNGKLEDMKLVESLVMDTKLTDAMLADVQLLDWTILVDTKLQTDMKLVDDKLVNPPRLLVGPSIGDCLCIKSMEEFGFLLISDFLLLSVSFLFLAYGCSVPFVYLVPYAISVGVDHQQAAFLMSILGIVGIVGNITFGWLTDRKCLKKYRTVSYMVAVGMEGLCCLFLPLLHSFALLVPFSMLYGYFDGAYVALIPVVTSDVVGSTYLTSALGVVYFLHAIPYLISPPIGGWLVDTTGDYTAAFLLSGFSLMLSPIILGTVMLIRRCWKTQSYSTSDIDSQFAYLKNSQMELYKVKCDEPKLPLAVFP
ncbi:monocarboxylate transporter 12-B [Osmerus mordax]|uniref:monocarboxylate transporter 12-B n=1 Tax=Osmerus mordax TaxID=8014 RepID=UPI00350FB35C